MIGGYLVLIPKTFFGQNNSSVVSMQVND